MVDKKALEEMAACTLRDTAYGNLRDILQMDICGDTLAQRMESYFAQIDNPYCFRVGKTPVRISYKYEGEPLEEKLTRYFVRLKG